MTTLSLVPIFASETNGLNMDAKSIKIKEQKEILALAENTKNACDLLINQCGSWLSAEEGLKNLKERKKKEKTRKKWLFFIVLLMFATEQMIADGNSTEQGAADYYAMTQQSYLASDNDSALNDLNQAVETVDTCNYQETANIYILRSAVYGNLTLFENSKRT